MNTADQILYRLKTRGPQTAQQLADQLEMTSMGARRQLEAAQEKGYVQFEDSADKVGRPARRWFLTAAGHARFPDRHADLTVQLIDQARAVFGESGLERLIAAREQALEAHYQMQLDGVAGLAERAAALAAVRDGEGYMAETLAQADGSVLLVEHHCPICAAAAGCQNFCRSELDIFRRVMGPQCSVERTDHLLAGARRCAYLIKPIS